LRSDHPGKISTRKKKPQQKCSNIVRTRQLDNLGLNLTNKEKEIFDDFGSDLLDDSLDAIVILDGVLWKIVQANKARNYYDQEILQKRAAELFRWNCISKFSTNYKTGMYYFKSKMKKYDQRSLKEQIILLMFAMKIRR
jgi:hypothetical protein